MRRSFLSVLFLASLIVGVESCKKGDTGAQGPAGPTGPQGAAGTAGAAGAAGAKGADGTKILSGTTAPTGGNDGDFYLNTSTKTLFGPKASGAWPATGLSLAGATGATGATGPTGATGVAGTKIISGAGAPGAGVGVDGDFYFDTATSIFYGPKTAGSWGTNQMPLGSAYAAKTFYITAGLENVTLVTNSKKVSEIAVSTWGNPEIFSSYKVLENDMIRINQYAGWGDNREMIFQSVPGSGIFDVIPQNGLPATWGPSPLNVGGNAASIFRVGAKFRYTQNFTNPTAEFTLTAEDIDRLTADNGAAFGYLTYAKAVPATVALGQNLTFYRTKNINVQTGADADGYRADYTAETNINLNTIPGLGNKIESYKQDGKVYLKYRYVNPGTKAPYYETTGVVGWIDLTSTYLHQYTVGGATFGPSGAYATENRPAYTLPFPAGGYNGNPFTTNNHPDGGTYLGNTGFTFTPYTNNVVTAATPTASQFRSGQMKFYWTINSGTNAASAPTAFKFGPITLNNVAYTGTDANVGITGTGYYDVVGRSLNNPAGTLATGWNYNTTDMTRPYWSDNTIADIYYKSPGSLTSNKPITGIGSINLIKYADGRPAADFSGIPLVQVQVFAIPGDVVKAAAAKGININNPDALAQFAETLK